MKKGALKLTKAQKDNRGMRNVTLMVTSLILASVNVTATAAPKPELWSKWLINDPQSQVRIDHDAWDHFLKTYVVADHPSGINRVRYGFVTQRDKKKLEDYLKSLEEVRVSGLNLQEQKAYWINLCNALTVKVVLDHYPVESIRDVDISPGWFKDGPWGAKLVKIEGEEVTLDDIEHRILRPVWKDNRVHYAVNCASIGCPNLQPEAFTQDNTEVLLEKGAWEYINHERGVNIEKGHLKLSSIYKWFHVDFGGSEEGVIQHLLKYAEEPLSGALRGFRGKIEYHYDWNLNE
jgi:hypothetical protein